MRYEKLPRACAWLLAAAIFVPAHAAMYKWVDENGKVQYVGIQASEKVSYNVAVIATGPSGHGSVPRPDNSVVHLAAAVQKLGTMETPSGFPAAEAKTMLLSDPPW